MRFFYYDFNRPPSGMNEYTAVCDTHPSEFEYTPDEPATLIIWADEMLAFGKIIDAQPNWSGEVTLVTIKTDGKVYTANDVEH